MKKALFIALALFIAVITTACINNIAVQELNNKASELMQKGDYEGAMNRLQASLDLDSTMYETYYNLGISATKAKKFEVAIDAFERGMKVKEDYASFYYSLGIAQYEYAENLLETSVFNEEKQEMVDKKISEEDKKKAEELKQSAVSNFTKYLEKEPNASEKAEIEELIKGVLNPKTEDVSE